MSSHARLIAAAGCVAVLVAACTTEPFLRPAVAQETPGDAESAPLAEQLVGTWKLTQAKTPGRPSGIGKRLKMFTGTRWSIVQPDDSGVVVFTHGGTYSVDGDVLQTTTDFAGQSTRRLIGRNGRYKIAVDGNTMRQADSNGVFNETWTRVD
ncbi:hypothetical protein [Alienimonas chondri]|uniref:Lipocalin-like domain-containing protein n=1 Tax=Alienimonas chondri TaxID=2681879 RepID=A0ABX1VGD6_9PLAN|nr:hypothetical protein [Alienimonas chondri]NNJ27101.1 hypothetical protein [Alienimonas chondri]